MLNVLFVSSNKSTPFYKVFLLWDEQSASVDKVVRVCCALVNMCPSVVPRLVCMVWVRTSPYELSEAAMPSPCRDVSLPFIDDNISTRCLSKCPGHTVHLSSCARRALNDASQKKLP